MRNKECPLKAGHFITSVTWRYIVTDITGSHYQRMQEFADIVQKYL